MGLMRATDVAINVSRLFGYALDTPVSALAHVGGWARLMGATNVAINVSGLFGHALDALVTCS